MRAEYPSADVLRELFRVKYGDPVSAGWGPALKWRLGYFSPDDVYEALIMDLVDVRTRWLDIGCGRDIFPSNRSLAKLLAERCARLVGVDPDSTITENPFVHESCQVSFEEYSPREKFSLVTMRMVAEHIQSPHSVIRKLQQCVQVGGQIVVYTVNGMSPVPLLTRLAPMGLRHVVKRVLWQTEEKDTFPTAYRMNSRRRLHRLFADGGFREELFVYLDDCRTFSRFRSLLYAEILLSKLFRLAGLRYPENCLLAVYVRDSE